MERGVKPATEEAIRTLTGFTLYLAWLEPEITEEFERERQRLVREYGSGGVTASFFVREETIALGLFVKE